MPSFRRYRFRGRSRANAARREESENEAHRTGFARFPGTGVGLEERKLTMLASLAEGAEIDNVGSLGCRSGN